LAFDQHHEIDGREFDSHTEIHIVGKDKTFPFEFDSCIKNDYFEGKNLELTFDATFNEKSPHDNETIPFTVTVINYY
jgi:hypothetical protein